MRDGTFMIMNRCALQGETDGSIIDAFMRDLRDLRDLRDIQCMPLIFCHLLDLSWWLRSLAVEAGCNACLWDDAWRTLVWLYCSRGFAEDAMHVSGMTPGALCRCLGCQGKGSEMPD